MLSIREESPPLNGEADRDDNLVKMAPHTVEEATARVDPSVHTRGGRISGA